MTIHIHKYQINNRNKHIHHICYMCHKKKSRIDLYSMIAAIPDPLSSLYNKKKQSIIYFICTDCIKEYKFKLDMAVDPYSTVDSIELEYENSKLYDKYRQYRDLYYAELRDQVKRQGLDW